MPLFARFLLVSVYFFTLFLIKVNSDLNGRNEKEVKIIGGNEANAGQYRFAAAIHVQTETSTFFCGGSIYTKDWILTSGHCVYGAILFTIQVGSNTLEGDDSNREILATSEYIVHPEFNPTTIENDIGLIKLRMSVTYSEYIQPVYLPFTVINDGDACISIGWGQTSDSEAQLSNRLRYVDTTSLSNAECKLVYGNQITDTMVCVSGNYNEGTCTGDSGSPLLEFYMHRYHYIVGISSFVSGNGCESTDPSGYTRVYPYLDWIRNVTNT